MVGGEETVERIKTEGRCGGVVRREGLGRASDFFSTVGRPTCSITVCFYTLSCWEV
jgi:hypothetical protein